MRNYLSEMLNALTSAYSRNDYENLQRGSPIETNIGKLFSIFAWGLDSIQEQAKLIKLWDDIDYAKGSVLDRYGANFGVKRNGATDAFYRLLIKVKLLSQLSGGDINTVFNAAITLFGVSAESITLTERFPAKISLDIKEADLDPETLDMVVEIMSMIKRILAAGVGLIATLQSYREFKNDVGVESALFDNTNLVFDLPDAERTFTQTTAVKNALFALSKLEIELPATEKRQFRQEQNTTFALFQKSNLEMGLPAANPRTFFQTQATPFVLFEHSKLNIGPSNLKQPVFKQKCSMSVAVFECSRITVKPVY